MRKLKILQMVDEPWDSGITSHALNLARRLSEFTDCVLLCRSKTFAAAEAARLGLRFKSWSGPLWFSYSSLLQWIGSEKFDILHPHTGSMHTLAWLAVRQMPHLRIVRTRADAKPMRRQWFYSKLLAVTQRFIFPTKTMRERFLVAYSYPLERALVLPPVIADVWGSAAADEQPPFPHTPRVVMVGRLDPVKGHRDFLRAAELVRHEFKEARFDIIGAQKNVSRDSLAAFARKLGIADRVEFCGHLQQEELKRRMSLAAVAVIASRGSEEVSRVCLEWMSLGIPLVATRVGMIAEILENGVTGLLTHPGSWEEIAYGVKRILREPEFAAALGRRAKERFLRDFSPLLSCRAHLKLYQEVVG